VIYHESTFLKINEELAAKTMHATAYQAGLVAKNAQAEALILGHYSSRYPDVNMFKQEAQEVFMNVLLAEDGKKFVFEN
jgi:metallo-beta-lactamase family protein